jgi:hypothetical protein
MLLLSVVVEQAVHQDQLVLDQAAAEQILV